MSISYLEGLKERKLLEERDRKLAMLIAWRVLERRHLSMERRDMQELRDALQEWYRELEPRHAKN